MNQSSPILELQRQRMLLEIEYFTEKEAYRKLTESRGLQRLVKRGDAWFPLRVGKSYYNSLNQLCIEVFRTTDNDIEHNFEFGRPVQFFKGPTSGEATSNRPSPLSLSFRAATDVAAAPPRGANPPFATEGRVGVGLLPTTISPLQSLMSMAIAWL